MYEQASVLNPLLMLATILAGMLSRCSLPLMGSCDIGHKTVMLCAVISFASGLVVMFFYYYCAQRNTPAIRLNPYAGLKREKSRYGIGLQDFSCGRWSYF